MANMARENDQSHNEVFTSGEQKVSQNAQSGKGDDAARELMNKLLNPELSDQFISQELAERTLGSQRSELARTVDLARSDVHTRVDGVTKHAAEHQNHLDELGDIVTSKAFSDESKAYIEAMNQVAEEASAALASAEQALNQPDDIYVDQFTQEKSTIQPRVEEPFVIKSAVEAAMDKLRKEEQEEAQAIHQAEIAARNEKLKEGWVDVFGQHENDAKNEAAAKAAETLSIRDVNVIRAEGELRNLQDQRNQLGQEGFALMTGTPEQVAWQQKVNELDKQITDAQAKVEALRKDQIPTVESSIPQPADAPPQTAAPKAAPEAPPQAAAATPEKKAEAKQMSAEQLKGVMDNAVNVLKAARDYAKSYSYGMGVQVDRLLQGTVDSFKGYKNAKTLDQAKIMSDVRYVLEQLPGWVKDQLKGDKKLGTSFQELSALAGGASATAERATAQPTAEKPKPAAQQEAAAAKSAASSSVPPPRVAVAPDATPAPERRAEANDNVKITMASAEVAQRVAQMLANDGIPPDQINVQMVNERIAKTGGIKAGGLEDITSMTLGELKKMVGDIVPQTKAETPQAAAPGPKVEAQSASAAPEKKEMESVGAKLDQIREEFGDRTTWVFPEGSGGREKAMDLIRTQCKEKGIKLEELTPSIIDSLLPDEMKKVPPPGAPLERKLSLNNIRDAVLNDLPEDEREAHATAAGILDLARMDQGRLGGVTERQVVQKIVDLMKQMRHDHPQQFDDFDSRYNPAGGTDDDNRNPYFKDILFGIAKERIRLACEQISKETI